jgi:hypothetical protein
MSDVLAAQFFLNCRWTARLFAHAISRTTRVVEINLRVNLTIKPPEQRKRLIGGGEGGGQDVK